MITLNCDLCKAKIEQNDTSIGTFTHAEPNYAMNQGNSQVVGMNKVEVLFCGECKKWLLNEVEKKTNGNTKAKSNS